MTAPYYTTTEDERLAREQARALADEDFDLLMSLFTAEQIRDLAEDRRETLRHRAEEGADNA